MRTQASEQSCGLYEVSGLNTCINPKTNRIRRTPKKEAGKIFLKCIRDELYQDAKGATKAFVFSDNEDTWARGQDIARYLKSNKLGNLTETEPFHNAGGSLRLRVWVFVPNQAKVVAKLKEK